jgi:hypothetical protein|nr:toll/interleukin-1 receptor domain-containing protein [uncultured Psychroserpens sp.]
MNKKYDVFISHASEDKNDLVRELSNELRKRGYRVWYDEFTLTVGDGLRKSIDYGISNSRYGIVILSKSFFGKGWPNYELDGLVQLNLESFGKILPIWHNLNQNDVSDYSPSLSNILAISTEGLDISTIANNLERKIGEFEYSVNQNGEILCSLDKKNVGLERLKAGFQIIKSIQTDELINPTLSNSRYEKIIYPYSKNYNSHEFQYWQNEPGELRLIRHIIYDLDNEEILDSKNSILKNDGCHLISKSEFIRKSEGPIKIVCDVVATNCFIGIFEDGYDYVEFDTKSRIDYFNHIFILPKSPEFQKITAYANDELLIPEENFGTIIYNHVVQPVIPKSKLRYSLINKKIRK